MARWDAAFVNAAHIPDGASYPTRWAAEAAAFRATARAELDLPYGAGERERFDLFLPDGAPRGTVIFVHGGYWRAFGREIWSHLAAGPVARGWAVAMPSYDLCPTIRISGITAQIARAVTAIAARMDGPLVLTGHSAGGHLVARMGCADVGLTLGDRIRRIVPISPVADLRPLIETTMNDDLRIDTERRRKRVPFSILRLWHWCMWWWGRWSGPSSSNRRGCWPVSGMPD